ALPAPALPGAAAERGGRDRGRPAAHPGRDDRAARAAAGGDRGGGRARGGARGAGGAGAGVRTPAAGRRPGGAARREPDRGPAPLHAAVALLPPAQRGPARPGAVITPRMGGRSPPVSSPTLCSRSR
ncbi:MAG: hypothetical protein EOO75_18840, partial [Myxococcales bacterium]